MLDREERRGPARVVEHSDADGHAVAAAIRALTIRAEQDVRELWKRFDVADGDGGLPDVQQPLLHVRREVAQEHVLPVPPPVEECWVEVLFLSDRLDDVVLVRLEVGYRLSQHPVQLDERGVLLVRHVRVGNEDRVHDRRAGQFGHLVRDPAEQSERLIVERCECAQVEQHSSVDLASTEQRRQRLSAQLREPYVAALQADVQAVLLLQEKPCLQREGPAEGRHADRLTAQRLQPGSRIVAPYEQERAVQVLERGREDDEIESAGSRARHGERRRLDDVELFRRRHVDDRAQRKKFNLHVDEVRRHDALLDREERGDPTRVVQDSNADGDAIASSGIIAVSVAGDREKREGRHHGDQRSQASPSW